MEIALKYIGIVLFAINVIFAIQHKKKGDTMSAIYFLLWGIAIAGVVD